MNRVLVLVLAWVVAGCVPRSRAGALVSQANQILRTLGDDAGYAEWAHWTNSTPASEASAAAANARFASAMAEVVRAARQVRGDDAATRRQLALLARQVPLPAPADRHAAEELARVRERLLTGYGHAACVGEDCRDAQAIGQLLRESRDPEELRRWWLAWHDAADPLAAPYERFVALSNQGARELGYADVGELWRSWYDLPPDELAAEVERLWGEVRPLYRKLHCHVRARLAEVYPGAVPPGGPIPVHLTGNLWGQDWRALAPIVGLEPPAPAALDLDPTAMVRIAEGFYRSLGFPPLPATFWERSMFVRPTGREVICQPGVHDLGQGTDVRLSMCLRPIERDLIDLHHELGHAYYDLATRGLTPLYRDSPHDGFHEAIGDALTLSMTSSYRRAVGLPPAAGGRLERLMMVALDKLPYLAFAVAVDEWRWEVFAGRIDRQDWNRAWWAIRERTQGIVPPGPRGDAHFDPGAKFHIASAHPYLRYFLALVLQFQIHAALCPAGPLDDCSIYGDRAAGARLQAFLALGASRPWPEALASLTGSRRMDAAPLLAYFAPLEAWLDEHNRGRSCPRE